jgi:hypothetical protein
MKGVRNMALLDDLKNVNVVKGPQCSVAKILNELEPKESAAVLAVIDDKESSLTALSAILLKYGYSINSKTLRRHRHRLNRGLDGCACL